MRSLSELLLALTLGETLTRDEGRWVAALVLRLLRTSATDQGTPIRIGMARA